MPQEKNRPGQRRRDMERARHSLQVGRGVGDPRGQNSRWRLEVGPERSHNLPSGGGQAGPEWDGPDAVAAAGVALRLRASLKL